jgi:hypothetical protein
MLLEVLEGVEVVEDDRRVKDEDLVQGFGSQRIGHELSVPEDSRWTAARVRLAQEPRPGKLGGQHFG